MPIIHGMSDAEYHARPELSSSGVRLLLPDYKGSPQKFQWERSHPRVSRAFDVGHAAHAKVLGVGLGVITYPGEHLTPNGNVSTKGLTTEWAAEQRAAGFTIVSPNEAAAVNAMSEALLANPDARSYLEAAVHREVSVFGDVEGVPSRARFDALSDETRLGVIGVDVKTTEDATKTGLEFTVKKYGYDVQEAVYRDVYEASVGHRIDRFAFLCVEKRAPYEVTVFVLPDMWVAMGRAKAKEARRIYQECTQTGVWPGYYDEVQVLDPPAWAVIEHEMRYEGGEIHV